MDPTLDVSKAPNTVAVTTRIEAIVESMLDALIAKKAISIPIRMKTPLSSMTASSGLRWREMTVSFPGKTNDESRRFVVLYQILGLIYEALTTGVVVSKRYIYYQNPALFRSQRVVDRYVDIIAYTFEVPRAALNVTAVAKGLVVGDFCWHYQDGSVSPADLDKKAWLIDAVSDIRHIDLPGVAWILVIEKESIFRRLASRKFQLQAPVGNGILITAKGYPDISTRHFLHLLSQARKLSKPPIYALMDFDPDGISIMSTYKYGSWRLSHENQHLNVPELRWLGIRSKDLISCNDNDNEAASGLLQLSVRDRKRAMKMLEKHEWAENGLEKEWRREIQVMLMLNVKAEMEILNERGGGVEAWMETQLTCMEEDEDGGKVVGEV